MNSNLDRRTILAGIPLLLAGCATLPQVSSRAYGPIADETYPVPGVDVGVLDRDLLRHEVPFEGAYGTGTIVVNVTERRLYLVKPGGRAVQYAVGVGREQGLNFRGSAVIGRKAEWPGWTPTESMIKRIPRYAAYSSGMKGGIDNPLGARALYLYRGGKDTHFRLHGTNDPTSIGKAVSSGCIRLFNQDIIDLYNRVPLGVPVFVLQS
jgi:lipoprotein-anchoring transpeptidase ErfK/SrfK